MRFFGLPQYYSFDFFIETCCYIFIIIVLQCVPCVYLITTVVKKLKEHRNIKNSRRCSEKLHLLSYLEMLWSETGYFGLLGNNIVLFIILLGIIER